MRLRLIPITILLFGMTALAVMPVRAQQDASSSGASMRGAPSIEIARIPGYSIWSDEDGFHVRWTSRGGPHRFTGDVATDGTITQFRRASPERGDAIRRVGNAIIWDAHTAGGPDGFDFALARGPDWMRFSLLTDGYLAPTDQIFIGGRGIHPAGNPFVLRFNEGFVDRWPAYVIGQPELRPGAFPGPGYIVWYDERGWHMRWTTRGWAREASGLVSTDGRFHEFRRVRLEGGDLVARDESLIGWESRGPGNWGSGDVDGIDFRTNGDRLSFTLLIDGVPAPPSQIFLGAGGAHPQRNPFRVTR